MKAKSSSSVCTNRRLQPLQSFLRLGWVLVLILASGCNVFPASRTASVQGAVTPAPGSPILPIVQKYRALIQKAMQQQHIPGLAIVLVDKNQVVWAEGFGYTDWDQQIPVTPDTPFSIQSMSKSFTATAVMLAVQDGLLDLDTPISQYLPNFHVHSIFERQPENKITLRHLLSHTAGFGMEAPVGNNYDTASGTFAEHIASISDTWLKFPVGQGFAYSNLGIDLAGYIVQVRSGMPFQTYVKGKLLDPLGMAHTSMDISVIRADPMRALGHIPVFNFKLPLIPMMPAGGVYTTANDLARYIQFQISLGMAGNKQLLDKKLVETMDTPQFLASSQNGYGLGMGVCNTPGATCLSHGGGGFGFLSMMTWYPQLGLGVAWLSNSSGTDLQNWLSQQILGDMINTNRDTYVQLAAANPEIPSKVFNTDSVAPLSSAELAAKIKNASLPVDSGAVQRWSNYAGIYGIRAWGWLAEFHTLSIKNKQIFLDNQPLVEVQPGLFFSLDGERLDLRGVIPTWRNIKLEKMDRPILEAEVFFGACGLAFLAWLLWFILGYLRSAIRSKTIGASSQTKPGWTVGTTRILILLGSILGIALLAVLSQYPILFFDRLPLPHPGLPLWQQVIFLIPYGILAFTGAAGVTLGLCWRSKTGTIKERIASSMTLGVLLAFALVVCF